MLIVHATTKLASKSTSRDVPLIVLSNPALACHESNAHPLAVRRSSVCSSLLGPFHGVSMRSYGRRDTTSPFSHFTISHLHCASLAGETFSTS
jgi:hypothetical protein